VLPSARANGTRNTTQAAKLALKEEQLDSGRFNVGPLSEETTMGLVSIGGLGARNATTQKGDGDYGENTL
jgi:hypothetical protein